MNRRWVIGLLICTMLLGLVSLLWSPSHAANITVTSETVTIDRIANPPP